MNIHLSKKVTTTYILPVTILLIGAGLLFHALIRDARFHPDEAHFMTFARAAAVNGDWMLSGSLDKPPLSIYSSAISMTFTGIHTLENGVLDLDTYRGEFSARLPNTLAAILLIAVVYRVTYHLFHRRHTALIAMLTFALSPYLIAFSPTAFTDMLMLLCVMLSLLASIRQRWQSAGILFILAIASKPQAVFYLPLILVLGEKSSGYIRRFSWTTLAGLLVLLIWDMARPEDSFLLLGFANNTSSELIQSDAFAQLQQWLDYSLILFEPLPLLLIGVFAAVIHLQRKPLILILWMVLYSLYHILFSANIYDRYLLLMLPPLIIVSAQGLTRVFRLIPAKQWRETFSLIVVGAIMTTGAINTSDGHDLIGGDHGNHDGIDVLAAHLNSKPVATVIYDPWLGWELGYYMGIWNNKRRVHYPSPEAMIADALELKESGARYLVAPLNENFDVWLVALIAGGFEVKKDYESDVFVVYELIPPAQMDGGVSTSGAS